MKNFKLFIFSSSVAVLFSCSHPIYKTNGETIYKTGKNLQGNKLLNKSASRITIVTNCMTCHGKKGDAMRTVSIKFSQLSNPNNYNVPYNDSLFYRFLDHDIKSDGTKVNSGVSWKMNQQDKKDLLDYLKTL